MNWVTTNIFPPMGDALDSWYLGKCLPVNRRSLAEWLREELNRDILTVVGIDGASLNWSVFAICFAVLAGGHPEEAASVSRVISSRRRSAAPSL